MRIRDVTNKGGADSGVSVTSDVDNGFPIDKGTELHAVDDEPSDADIVYVRFLQYAELYGEQNLDYYVTLVKRNGMHPSAAFDEMRRKMGG